MITLFRILLLLAFWWSIVLHAPKPHHGLLPHVDPRAVICTFDMMLTDPVQPLFPER